MKDVRAFSKLVSFISPKDIVSLAGTSKRIRVLLSSHSCMGAVCKSVVNVKNREIRYYHNQIEHF